MYGMKLVYFYLFEISIGVFLVVLLLALVISIYSKRKQQSIIKETLEKLGQEYGFSVLKAKGRNYDYELEKEEIKLLIKVATVPVNSSITINSRNTWCLRFGGSAYHGGYSNLKYLKKLIPFLEAEYKEARKIIIVYPDTQKVQRYLNESEIAIVKSCEKVYDYRVVTFVDLESRFQDLL